MGNKIFNLYKLDKTFDNRYVEYKRISSKYKNKIPIILHKYLNNSEINDYITHVSNDYQSRKLPNDNSYKMDDKIDNSVSISNKYIKKYNIYMKLMVDPNLNISNINDIIYYKFYKNNDIHSQYNSIFIYTVYENDYILLNPSNNIKYIYNKYKDEDGFLYLYFCKENVFG